MYKFRGKHILAEFYGVSVDFLNDYKKIRGLLKKGIELTEVTMLNECFHKFEPNGFTLLILLAESHISIHTYPEKKAFFMDVFTCGDKEPEKILKLLEKSISYENFNKSIIIRGEERC